MLVQLVEAAFRWRAQKDMDPSTRIFHRKRPSYHQHSLTNMVGTGRALRAWWASRWYCQTMGGPNPPHRISQRQETMLGKRAPEKPWVPSSCTAPSAQWSDDTGGRPIA